MIFRLFVAYVVIVVTIWVFAIILVSIVIASTKIIADEGYFCSITIVVMIAMITVLNHMLYFSIIVYVF